MIHSELSTTQTSPAAKLLPDVLSLVFSYLNQSWDRHIRLPFQVKLSHVCQHWREVALSTPRLWSNITFLVDHKRSEYVREWLIRSRQAPLHIWIVFTKARARAQFRAPQEATFQLLASHIHRFRTLVVSALSEDIVNYIYQLFDPVEAPLLEELIIRCSLDGFQKNSHGAAFNRDLPKLASADLPSFRCLPPLTNITDLRIRSLSSLHRPTLSRLAEAILIPHHLISLSIEGCVFGHNDDVLSNHDHPTIILPELQYLELAQREETACLYLMNNLQVPKLEYLRLTTLGTRPYYVSASGEIENPHYPLTLESMSPPNLPWLKCLTLDGQFFSIEYLSLYIRVFPFLTRILFINPEITDTHPDQWKEFFHMHISPARSWPDLKVFAFEQVSWAEIELLRFSEEWPPTWTIVGDPMPPEEFGCPRIQPYEPEKHGLLDYWSCRACGRRCNRQRDCYSQWGFIN